MSDEPGRGRGAGRGATQAARGGWRRGLGGLRLGVLCLALAAASCEGGRGGASAAVDAGAAESPGADDAARADEAADEVADAGAQGARPAAPWDAPAAPGARLQGVSGWCALGADGRVRCRGPYTGGDALEVIEGLPAPARRVYEDGRGVCALDGARRVHCVSLDPSQRHPLDGREGVDDLSGDCVVQGAGGQVRCGGALAGVTMEGARRVAAGEAHVCALLDGGRVACAGDNRRGQLAAPAEVSWSDAPREIALPGVAVDVAAGRAHACALLHDGSARCWGRDAQGELGDGEGRGQGAVQVAGLEDGVALASAPLAWGTCALRRGGQVACWGANDDGEFGAEAQGALRRVGPQHAPLDLVEVNSAVEVSVRPGEVCARMRGGQVACQGRSPRYTPRPVPGLEAIEALEVAGDTTCARDADDVWWCWGQADALSEHRPRPEPVADDDPARARLAARPWVDRRCALRRGKLRCDDVAGPLPEARDLRDATLTGGHVDCAALASGRLACWGVGAALAAPWSATLDGRAHIVRGVEDVVEVGAGERHVCARTRAGQVWCWGSNQRGALGDGGGPGVMTAIAVAQGAARPEAGAQTAARARRAP